MDVDQASSRWASLDRLGVGALALDHQFRVVRANRAASDRLGVSEQELVARTIGDLFDAPDSITSRLAALALSAGPRTIVPGVKARRGGGIVTLDLIADGSTKATSARVGAGESPEPAFVITMIDADERFALQSELNRLQSALADSERQRDKIDALRRELSASASTGGAASGTGVRIIGSSAAMLEMLDQVERVARSDATVLIHGESGSGKELVARSIHAQSARTERAMIAVNCAAIPETLLESELFGHERGAFTGAEKQRLGKFELADEGSLFLDEIAELSLAAQAKLLRVLQEGTFERVGGTQTITVDVRVIAATHRDLAIQVERGRFREDLYYRLNVFRIEVPGLRDRREDIRQLAEFFHDLHARRQGRPVLPISDRSLRRLLTYDWPGNVRELENTVERATVLADEGDTELEIELPESRGMRAPRTDDSGGGTGPGGRDTSNIPRDVLLDLNIDQLQRLQIMHALETRKYRVFGKDGAAEKLGINPQTLLSRMDKLGIPRPRAMRRAMEQ